MRIKMSNFEVKEALLEYIKCRFKTIGSEDFCDISFVSDDGFIITDLNSAEVIMDEKEFIDEQM